MKKRAAKRAELPPYGDTGPQTEAQLAGAEVVEWIEKNGQRTRSKHRKHILEIMARPRQAGRRAIPARITPIQLAAGLALVNAFEATQKSPDLAWTRIYVDSTPRPGDAVVIQIDAQSTVVAITRCIPRECWPVVNHVCRWGLAIKPGLTKNSARADEHLMQLRRALDIVAKRLGMTNT